MNYYIQGNKEKAEEIKAAFEKLGYDISWPEGCANPDVINIGVERNGAKYVVAETSEYIKDIIKTHPDYKELELAVKSKFKVGDWIVQNDNGTVSQITKTINAKDEFGEYRAYEHTNGYFAACFENEYHIWTIQDAKDGDVITNGKLIVIFNKLEEPAYKQHIIAYVGLDLCGRLQITEDTWQLGIDKAMPATKEQRDLLFAKMKEAGYEWDADKKELRRIIEPQFKVGDEIKTGNTIETIAEVSLVSRSYICESGRTIWFENQDMWHLVLKPHYDITNFEPKQWVLVRDDDEWEWDLTRFSYLSNGSASLFVCINGALFQQCIPFNEKTKHLLGTTDMCDERYINW